MLAAASSAALGPLAGAASAGAPAALGDGYEDSCLLLPRSILCANKSWEPVAAPTALPAVPSAPAQLAAAAAAADRVRLANPSELGKLHALLFAAASVDADGPLRPLPSGTNPAWREVLPGVPRPGLDSDVDGYESAGGEDKSVRPFGTGPRSRRVSRPARLSSPDLPSSAPPAARRAAVPQRPRGKHPHDADTLYALHRPYAAAKPPPPHGARGAALRWTPEEDAQLALAVSQNRKAPDKRSLNGIQWAAIQRRAQFEYPLLLRHLTSARGSKTCAKRWCQYLCPEDQLNKSRKWR